ncbi:hypothetical protein IM40_00175 [Candidatus Paracaedimonas acanthamoebae]|nr:hypothetical protein IM40_00175 [Candidatus Paracaedimonas acanthamoebae]
MKKRVFIFCFLTMILGISYPFLLSNKKFIFLNSNLEKIFLKLHILNEQQYYFTLGKITFLTSKSKTAFIHANFKEVSLTTQKSDKINDSTLIELEIPNTSLPSQWQILDNELSDVTGKYRFKFKNFYPLFSTNPYSQVFLRSFKVKDQSYIIIGSPEVDEWLVYSQGILIPITMKLKNGASSEENYLKSIIDQAIPKFDQYLVAIKQGGNPLNAMADFIFGRNKFKERLAQSFISEKGKKLKNIILNTQDTLTQLRAAFNYLDDIEKDKIIYLSEIVIANTILEAAYYFPFLEGEALDFPLKDAISPIPIIIKLISDKLIEKNKPKDDLEKILLLSMYNKEFMQAVPDVTIFKHELVAALKQKKGHCGTFSRLLAAMLNTQHIKSRIIEMYNYPKNTGHVILEILLNNKWIALDPTYTTYFYKLNDNGKMEVFNFAELRSSKKDYNIKQMILNKKRHLRGGELAQHYTSINMYKQSDPAGVTTLDNPMFFPLNLEPNDIIDLKKPTSAFFHQGGHALGNTFLNINHKLKLHLLTKGRKYKLTYLFSSMGGNTRDYPFFIVEAARGSLGASPYSTFTYSYQAPRINQWNIIFTAKSPEEIFYINHRNNGERIYMMINEIMLSEIK